MKQDLEHKYVMEIGTNSEVLLEKLMNTVAESEIGCTTTGNKAYKKWFDEWSKDNTQDGDPDEN